MTTTDDELVAFFEGLRPALLREIEELAELDRELGERPGGEDA